MLQPPTIRHRVLECGDGLEVLELGSPAEHATLADHAHALPDAEAAGQTYGGQRFVRFVGDQSRRGGEP